MRDHSLAAAARHRDGIAGRRWVASALSLHVRVAISVGEYVRKLADLELDLCRQLREAAISQTISSSLA